MQDMRKESEFAIENNSQKPYVIHNRNSNIVYMNDRVKMNASLPTEVDAPTLLGRDSMSEYYCTKLPVYSLHFEVAVQLNPCYCLGRRSADHQYKGFREQMMANEEFG
ncbi:hypothetical protein AVEN_14117-1 [Araneus ventricosus]|uniref:Uncharacterized protein n=1 Tax=Araneus ventricosus TaxID=182803 RepID=A0A4Y2TJD7_ARAVE|nr:hypothetical protein AVEN_14117-1 [Araneus ventricosus]